MTKTEFIENVVNKFSLSKYDLKKINSQLDIYKDYLQKQNKIINLTKLDNDCYIWQKYFWESILVYHFVNFKNIKTVLDVGSGSGIPGFIIKIFFPHIKLTIVEANHKKCLFMKNLSILLKLKNLKIICCRIENLSKKYQFDLATARAVAPLEIILELLIPFAKINGQIIIPKSKNYYKEIKNLDKLLMQMGAKLKFIDEIKEKNNTFCTINAIKIRKTNPKYPRKYQNILKGFDYDS